LGQEEPTTPTILDQPFWPPVYRIAPQRVNFGRVPALLAKWRTSRRLVSNLRGALAFRFKRRSSRWALPVPAAFLGPSVAPAAGGHLFVRAPMSRVPWHLLQERQQRAHLVVAVLRADQLGGEPNPRAAQIVLARIVKIQKPSSYYATTVVREAGRPQVQLAFEDKGDARKYEAKPYASEVEAREVGAAVGNVKNNRPELMERVGPL
jgi:hypothetical protein